MGADLYFYFRFWGVFCVREVFLDLPAPWEAIPHAVNALRVSVIFLFYLFG